MISKFFSFSYDSLKATGLDAKRRIPGAGVIIGVFVAFFYWLPAMAAPSKRPPNVIVILADDLGCGDIGLYHGWVPTPNIDKLASQGMTFSDFHSNSSVCSPSRVAFLTGRYQQRLGIVDVIVGDKEPNHGIPPSTPTIADVFRKNGYATALFGKWHCGYQDEYNPIHHGFDKFIGFLNGGCDYFLHNAWRNGLKKQDVKGYSTDIITDNSIRFINNHKKQPFFLYVSEQLVHNPYQTRADTPDSRKKGWRQCRVDAMNQPRYKLMVKDLDDSVGRIMKAVRVNGLASNTLVFFWSDNGDVQMSPAKYRPFRGGKFSQYEGGTRIPAVAWWPGKIKAGTTSSSFLAGFDLFPTLTDMVGIAGDDPKNLDGSSFKSLLLHQTPFPDRDIFFGYEPKLGTAMRHHNWKMIIKGDHVQLYNLADDLRETTNVVDNYPKVAKYMEHAIAHFKKTVVPGS